MEKIIELAVSHLDDEELIDAIVEKLKELQYEIAGAVQGPLSAEVVIGEASASLPTIIKLLNGYRRKKFGDKGATAI